MRVLKYNSENTNDGESKYRECKYEECGVEEWGWSGDVMLVVSSWIFKYSIIKDY